MTERIWLRNYPSGIPAEIDADRYRSIPDMFEQTVARFSDRPSYHNLGHTLTYAELERLSRNFAAFLQGLPNMAKGDRVAIMSPNLLQYPVALLGILRAGMTVVCTLHSNSERLALRRLKSRLEAALPSLPVILSRTDRDPFSVR